MILSASRRTDVPAFYSEWFFNRLKEGYALVRNPFNPHSVSRVELSPDIVDGIVFWSKNPAPLLPKLRELDDYAPYYFQFTLTGYQQEVEPFKTREVIDTFRNLSDAIGPQRVIWRYDPIFLSDKYSADFHFRAFEQLCNALRGYTNTVTISFLVRYRSILRHIAALNLQPITEADKLAIAERFVQIAASCNISVNICAEETDLSPLGVGRARCVDPTIFEHINGIPLKIPKDKNQRNNCSCAESIDIGEYDTCRHGCVYCYANHNPVKVAENARRCYVNSPLIVGKLSTQDIVTNRRCLSFADKTYLGGFYVS